MLQINKPAPDLNVAEWVQGKPSNIRKEKGKVIVITIFQINCPGCFSRAFPEILESYKKFSNNSVAFWGLATAIDNFELNNYDNLLKLLLNGEVVGETLYNLGNQGLLKGNRLSYTIPFPVALDNIKPSKPEEAYKNAQKMIKRNFPGFSQMPKNTQKKITEETINYHKNKRFIAETFESYEIQGTPSNIIVDKKGYLRFKWFGTGFGITKEIEKLLSE